MFAVVLFVRSFVFRASSVVCFSVQRILYFVFVVAVGFVFVYFYEPHSSPVQSWFGFVSFFQQLDNKTRTSQLYRAFVTCPLPVPAGRSIGLPCHGHCVCLSVCLPVCLVLQLWSCTATATDALKHTHDVCTYFAKLFCQTESV